MGVVFVLSTLEFLLPDRGVMLLPRNGVEIPSLDEVAGVMFFVRANGVVAVTGVPAPATLGLNGVLMAVLLMVGMSGFAP